MEQDLHKNIQQKMQTIKERMQPKMQSAHIHFVCSKGQSALVLKTLYRGFFQLGIKDYNVQKIRGGIFSQEYLVAFSADIDKVLCMKSWWNHDVAAHYALGL